MNCPKCGYAPPRGRPKKLDDERILKLHAGGMRLNEIAKLFNVTSPAILAAIKRTKKK